MKRPIGIYEWAVLTQEMLENFMPGGVVPALADNDLVRAGGRTWARSWLVQLQNMVEELREFLAIETEAVPGARPSITLTPEEIKCLKG